jgi:predicted GIY-YIG superfamily endonuclease
MLYFIYKLVDPRDDTIGYVGISNNPNARYKQHVNMQDTNEKKIFWIQQLLQENIQPKMRIIEMIEEDEGEAYNREKYWIQYYLEKGVDLTNIQYVGNEEYQDEHITTSPNEHVTPLTETQIMRWCIAYGPDDSKRKNRVTAKQLYTLFALNNETDNIQGSDLWEKRIYLTKMLLNTPKVLISKKTTPWTFSYAAKRPLVMRLCDLQTTIFPDDIE